GHRPERHQPASAHRQQPDLRRRPLERSLPDLCRGALPVPVLGGTTLGGALHTRRMGSDRAPSTGRYRGVRGLCLDPHDLAISKYVAFREKDLIFTRELARRGLISRDQLLALLAQTN